MPFEQIFEEDKDIREEAMQIPGERVSQQRKQPVQRPCGRNMSGSNEDYQEDKGSWSKVSEVKRTEDEVQ